MSSCGISDVLVPRTFTVTLSPVTSHCNRSHEPAVTHDRRLSSGHEPFGRLRKASLEDRHRQLDGAVDVLSGSLTLVPSA
jgi:hypothetical protein